jgi:hypothetical protein
MKTRLKTIIFTILAFAFARAPLFAQPAERDSTHAKDVEKGKALKVDYPDSYLDTVSIKRVFMLNDYSMIGAEYGVSVSRTMFAPTKKQTNLFVPQVAGVYYTRYGKMFGYLPYFGMKIGVRYSSEGYRFKPDKETGVSPDVEGATQAIIKIVDAPFMAMFHVDTPHFSVFADAGIYGGYRLSIERTGNRVDPDIANSFLEYDHRFDYGLTGGVGFALVFDPFEFQVNANVRYSWGSLYAPDYASKDYYRFAYPFDVMLTGGLYFHITRRTGKTKPQLRREAYEHVYHPEKNENTEGTSR